MPRGVLGCGWHLGSPAARNPQRFGPSYAKQAVGFKRHSGQHFRTLFTIADAQGWLLLDHKDLTALIRHGIEHGNDYEAQYGSLPSQSLQALLRKINVLEGSDTFFGEPACDVSDF